MSIEKSLDIFVPVEQHSLNKCLICNREFANGKMALPAHVVGHKIEFSEYLIRYYLNGNRPKCPICSKETRYNRGKYSFKKYCLEHSAEGRKEWSKKYGFGVGVKPDWKKGLTKETNEAIKQHSLRMMGENNPFFGKKHSEEIIKKISEKRSTKTRITVEEFEQRKDSNNSICLSSYEQYVNSVNRNLNYLCLVCKNTYSASLQWHDCTICNKPSSKLNL